MINLLCRRIFKRDVTSWDAPEITSVNPNLEIEEDKAYPINVARRLLGSSSTMIFTEFLHKTCPSEWDQVGSIIEWPEDTMICEGSSAMTKCINEKVGTIGYVDSGHGHSQRLQEVAVEMDLRGHDGFFLTSKVSFERGGIISALESKSGGIPERADDDWSQVDLINQLEVRNTVVQLRRCNLPLLSL